MESAYQILTINNVLASLLLVALAMGLSWINQSRLERHYLIGAVRSFIQLWLLGYALVWLFEARNLFIYLLVIELMIVVGAYTACQRQDVFRYETFGFLWLALHGSVMIVGGYFFVAVVPVLPTEQPNIFLPLTGMIVGNCANGAALSVHRLRGEVASHRGEIEVALSLGASPKRAVQPYIADTLRNALIPSINSMMLMGIVHIPGIMTGQMISGIVPDEAIRYQIVVVYLLAGSVALTCHLALQWEVRSYFTKRWQLLDID